eukprot:3636444-Rhodomonas_salina.1
MHRSSTTSSPAVWNPGLRHQYQTWCVTGAQGGRIGTWHGPVPSLVYAVCHRKRSALHTVSGPNHCQARSSFSPESETKRGN